MTNIIFYFSGTGNSLAVAKSLAEKLTDTEVISVSATSENKILSDYDKIGFVFPCNYGHPPQSILNFVKNMQTENHPKIFFIVTYAGTYGFALSDLARLLPSYSESEVRGFSVRMPGSHILGYPAFPKFYQRMLFKRTPKRIDKIAYAIQHDKPARIKIKNPNSKKKTFFDSLVKSANKLLGVKKIESTEANFFTMSSCVHCGICEKLCPVENITVSSEEVLFGNNCQQCMACIQWCPQAAISHPKISAKRKHYHHPDIKLDDMIRRRN